jgi:hypothetical protein
VHVGSFVGGGRLVELLGARRQRATDAADLGVRRSRDDRVDPAFEQLGQRELQQRQRAGSGYDVADHRRDQTGLEANTDLRGRTLDRLLQLGGGHRGHRQRARADDRPEPLVLQRAVVEIGAQRHDHPHDVLRARRAHEQRGEPVALLARLAERPELLELVDHEHELLARRDHAARDLDEPVVTHQATAEIAVVRGRHPPERRLELGQRIGTGHHRHDLRAEAPQSGGRTRVHDRALPRPRRADHRDERIAHDSVEQPVDQRAASVELRSIRLAERAQTLVRVDRTDADARRDPRAPRFRGETNGARRAGHLGLLRGEQPRVDEPGDRVEPVRRMWCRGSGKDVVECGRNVHDPGETRHRLTQLGAEQLGDRRPGERCPSGDGLPRHDPQRVLVRRRGGDAVACLLRAGVQRRSCRP